MMIKFSYFSFYLFLTVIPIIIINQACSDKNSNSRDQVKGQFPNIVYILADDLGYGDLGCYNLDSKIPTPNIDNLAEEGIRFLDMHSPSAVCTPTRYGILTGRYCWRSPLKKGVLLGYSRPIISPEQETVASLMKKAGYHTACIGKWHLGLGWALEDGSNYDIIEEVYEGTELSTDETFVKEHVDYSATVTGGPNDLGFDYSYILPASLDFEPYCYLENGMLEKAPTYYTEGNDMNTGFTEAFWRAGNMAEGFEFEQVLPNFISKASEYIESRVEDRDSPFFLYLPLAAPHTPWVPTEEFREKSRAGTYGDFVNMVDHYVGELLSLLDEKGLSENTLIILTSDNGAFWKDDYKERYGHFSNHQLRGMKADAWEGGNRVPFIAKWYGMTSPGSTNSNLACLTDLMATLSELSGIELEDNTGQDSRSILSYLKGESISDLDRSVILHSSKGMFAIRWNNWKYITGSGGGGFGFNDSDKIPGDTLSAQLYDLSKDRREQNNLLLKYPEIVDEMKSILKSEGVDINK
jgi:arylsulfatase A